jgi:dUTP pyrophosphatase
MTSPTLRIIRLAHSAGLPLPAYETTGAAGLDLRAALPDGEPVTVAPGERAALPTGICIAVPEGFEAQIRPRSGLALRHGITCLNSPGTIDADYRGEIKIILVNLGSEPVTFHRGDRVAQMVIAPVARAILVETETLDKTTRGGGGFGSTGLQ